LNQSGPDLFENQRAAKLLDSLIAAGLLIPTRRLERGEWPVGLPADTSTVYEHQRVGFWSYPYEWPFTLLKKAALSQLEVLRRCLERGFVLKDASAYDVQFVAGKPVLIDILSIEPYRNGTPWTAYGQFCGHFLNPLLITSMLKSTAGRFFASFPTASSQSIRACSCRTGECSLARSSSTSSCLRG
jgi:hypothetical protein